MHNIVWAAGLFEGEGSICIVHPTSRPNTTAFKLQLNMTDKDVVAAFARVVKLGCLTGPYLYNYKNRPNNKPRWCWCANGPEALFVLRRFLPYLFARRKKTALEAISNYLSRNKQNRNKGKVLNG